MSHAVATTSPDHLPLAPAASESAAILSVIERMATNPDIDPDRIERYMTMYEKMGAKKAEQAFGAAMTAAQSEMSVVVTNAENPQTRSRYANYAQLDRALRPIYSKHGFSLSFNDGTPVRDDWVRIECFVSHVDGHTRLYHKDMPADGKGAKGNDVMTKTHAVGAAQSYAMRYLLRMIFNVAVGEEDVDGNVRQDVPTITAEQVAELRTLIKEAAVSEERFCALGKVERMEDIAASDFAAGKKLLTDRIKARASKVDPKAQFDQMERDNG